ncbi:glycosyl hydrolase 108 family protein [Niveispirillum sp.]|uniref:glycoside hydrolase family 108 protein n=1 Tax=Niveispirillum sp. TaxID=1917217 RepID=UPI001B43DF61|nr:glycosyl hydrolase 108 family protein [Niveispirillum sp.]MBP7340452.1 hypothetical protein [Niveispirillum sp.]
MDEVNSVISEVLRREGWPQYTDHPADRGGPTKGGITLATLSAWRRRPVKAEDVRALGEAEARAIYAERYITAPRFDQINDPALRGLVIDAGVLSGPGQAAKWLQLAVGAKADGIIGPATLAAIARRPANAIRLAFTAARVRFFGDLVQQNANARQAGRETRDQALFVGGWLDRAMTDIDAMARDLDRAGKERTDHG